MTTRGVLFDFSGTLFRLELGADWLDGLVDDAAAAELMRRLTAPTGRLESLPPELHEAWDRRDLDPELHREVYLAALTGEGITEEAVAAKIYDRMLEPSGWQPYPDTERVLRALAEAGTPVGVLSNIAWDIRAVFDRYGLAGLPDTYVLSYVEGRVKPDPELFRTACARLGLPPEEVLMVGDSREADGGATAIGCAFAHVEPLATADRPDALLAAVTGHGLLAG
ncbi:HAD superfamily hydrolase (TIGR01509 family) [Crossiella equi]|uniref:HAD superfamily hydrolase (TIGR01509 family) n=1 Tax=Crossiella equi TaxID=130796 RepID=A0ABS5AEZ1_9PSEU|nr:HAD-IA family hydrolase [Crossiella equi]MBP2475159.1 HAD superfamily hydrolase (TIGR01509 family) [Crossiella equi]